MANFSVADATGSGSGYNVTVAGDGPSGSAVFKEYCPGGACGSAGYVTSGKTLAANSLTLNSTSATFSAQNGTTGTAPTHSCNSGCFVDSASPVKVISAATKRRHGHLSDLRLHGVEPLARHPEQHQGVAGQRGLPGQPGLVS